MGSWTQAGFEAKSLEYYKAAIQQVFVDAYGNDFLLDDSLPQGVLIQELAELFYNADMDGIEAFSRLNINTATGVYLDLFGSMRGLARSQGTPQIITAEITSNAEGFSSYTIPEGHVFTATNGDTFVTSQYETITTTTQSIYLTYTKPGNSSVAINDGLSTEGFSQITNIQVTYMANGTERETDLEYRTRILSESPVPDNTLRFVMNKLLELQTVKTVGVNYNDTAVTVDSIPAYCTEWMAVPKDGADLTLFKQQVAKVIVDNKVPGSPTAGNTTQTVTDVFGTSKTINFTIPTKVDLKIVCTITAPEGGTGVDLSNKVAIQETILKYIGSLGIGTDVSFSRVLAPLAADTGFDVVSLVIEDVNETTVITNGNYPIGNREYASVNIANIVIGV